MPTPAEWSDPEYRERLRRFSEPLKDDCDHDDPKKQAWGVQTFSDGRPSEVFTKWCDKDLGGCGVELWRLEDG